MKSVIPTDVARVIEPAAKAVLGFLARGDLLCRELAPLAGGYVRAALAEAMRDRIETAHDRSVRRFLLDPQDTYAIEELAALWRIPRDDARAIYHDEVEAWKEVHPDAANGLPVQWIDALAASAKFNLLRAVDVERALGAEFERARPQNWRTTPVIVSLPRWLVEAVQCDVQSVTLAPSNASMAMRIERVLLDLFAEEHKQLAKSDLARAAAARSAGGA